MHPLTARPAYSGTRYSDSPALSPRARLRVIALVVLLQLLFVFALVLGLAGGPMALVRQTQPPAAYSVPLDKPSPEPSPAPPKPEAPAAKPAPPKVAIAMPTRLPAPAVPAAPATGIGVGAGAGSADSGVGTGSGNAGEGDGGGGPPLQSLAKIAGDISSVRDYPERGRDLRLGSRVVIVLTVGADGRAHGCRIQVPSPDPESDAITCRLAVERFRFRPATDRRGSAIDSDYGWEQRWFKP